MAWTGIPLDRNGLLPQLDVLLDVTNPPTSTTRTWTSIVRQVRSLAWSRSGRSDELQRTTAGTASLLLDNRGDAITSLGVAKAQWCSIRALWAGVTYELWRGIITSLPRQWPDAGKDALLTVSAADALYICRLVDLAGLTYASQRADQRIVTILSIAGFPVGYANSVLAFRPSLYWRLGESSGTVAADASGNGRTGTYGAGVTLGQTGALVGDPNTAVLFHNLSFSDSVGAAGYDAFSAGQRTFMGWANRTSTTSTDQLLTDNGGRRVLWLSRGSNDVQFFWDSNHVITWTGAWPGVGQYVHWALVIDDSTGAAELFINGVSQGQQFASGFLPTFGGFFVGTEGTTTTSFGGDIDEVAVYEQALTSFSIAGIYRAGLVAAAGTFDSDSDTLDAVSTPLAIGSDGLSALLAVEGSDNGLLVANPDGSMTYQGRHWRIVNSTVSQLTFGESGQVPYRDSVSYEDDDSRLANTVTVTPLGGGAPQTASDVASQTKYFTRRNQTADQQLLSSSELLALSAAQYLVSRYKDPPPRIPEVEVDLAAVSTSVPAKMPTLLGLGNSNRVTWTRQAATPISVDTYVEQINHVVNPGVSWQMKLQLSPASNDPHWVLGDSVNGALGSTTALSY